MRPLLLIALPLLSACASFEAGELPGLDRWPLAAAPASPAPTLRVEASGLPDKFAGGWLRDAAQVCRESGRFANVTIDPDAPADRVLRFDVEHSRPDGLPMTRVFMYACALTLGVIPARAYHRFVVHARFLAADGAELGVVDRTVESQTWVGWVFLFALPFAGAGTSGLFQDTTRSALVEAVDAGWL